MYAQKCTTRPKDAESGALLLLLDFVRFSAIVGITGLEPATSRPPAVRHCKLNRYKSKPYKMDKSNASILRQFPPIFTTFSGLRAWR